MKFFLYTIACTLLSSFSFAQNKVPIDGPYLFYQGDSIIVKTLVQQEDLVTAATQSYSRAALSLHPLNVPVLADSIISFSVGIDTNLSIPPSIYPGPEKLFVLSDIEGEFKAGRDLLIAGHVIDQQYKWKGRSRGCQ